MLDDVGLCLASFFKEEFPHVPWELLLEDVAHKPFAYICSAAFVAEDVAEGRVAGMEGGAVVITGVAACAEDADDAWFSLAHASGSSEHVALHVDGDIIADGLPQGLGNDGCFLGRAAGSVEVDS